MKMGLGRLRRIATISQTISTSTEFPTTTSGDPESAIQPPPDNVATTISKSRKTSTNTATKGVRRRSIYVIEEPDSNTGLNDKPAPPDGGYGWVIVIAVHFLMAMGMGFLTSLGIFFIEWRKDFGSSAAETSLVTALSSVVLGVISPIAVGIAGKVGGSRPLVMTGAVIVFIGLLFSSYATSIAQLTFTIGVFTAFGYGLICSTSVLVIADYFDDNYGLANGIAFAGVSIGQLIFPPLSVEFIYWFGGWRGAMFIFSALLLNIAACGALLRPIKHSKSRRSLKSKSKPAVQVLPPVIDIPRNNMMTYQNAGFVEDLSYNVTPMSSTSRDKHSNKELPVQTENEQPILEMTTVCDGPKYLKSPEPPPPLLISEHLSSTFQKYLHKFKTMLTSLIMFIASCYGIPGVFLSPLFVIMIPAIFCVAIGWYATVTHQAARAISDGISEADASLLLSLMGIGSLIGRVGHGWLIDRGFITSETCLVLSLGVCSVFTYLVPLARFFPVLCITAAVQGASAGIANTLMCVMVKTFVKPSYEDASLGMLYLFWGFGDLTGGVVAGYLYDSTGNYNVSFYFAGTALAVSTLLVYATCVLKERIVNKLYAKLALKQLHMSRGASSGELLDNIVATDNLYDGGIDNDVFLDETPGDEADANVVDSTVVVGSSRGDRRDTGTHCPLFQIEIHDEWERACGLTDTNV